VAKRGARSRISIRCHPVSDRARIVRRVCEAQAGEAQRRVGPAEASRLFPLGSPAAGLRLIEVANSEPFFIRRTIDRSHLPPRWPRVPSYKRQAQNLRAAADAIAATLRCRDRRPVALAPRTRCRSRAAWRASRWDRSTAPGAASRSTMSSASVRLQRLRLACRSGARLVPILATRHGRGPVLAMHVFGQKYSIHFEPAPPCQKKRSRRRNRKPN
jgi:hypothetical protein